MQDAKSHSEHFSRFQQVTDVGTAVFLAGRTATALFNKTKAIYEGMMKLYDGIGDLEVEGKLKLGYTYPTAHPVQTERAETMWEVMTQGGYDRIYSTDGCSWSLKWDQNGIMSAHESLEAWLGMADENGNWNEGLDYEWSKDMHLVYPFHNLYDNRHFSLYDLVLCERI